MIANRHAGSFMSRTGNTKTTWTAYGVHCLTASGIIPAGLAMFEITQPDCDARIVFVYLFLTTLIDAIDGPLARRYHVKQHAAAIDGRTMDDLLDYLTFAFIPLMLVWRLSWLPGGLEWTVTLAMGASLFGFAHRDAKDEANGYFRGFPSYWNVFAFYAGLLFGFIGPWAVASLMWGLTILTVSPVKFIYPNLAPKRFRSWLLGGAIAWSLLMLAMLPSYPDVPVYLAGLSLVYPVAYIVASAILATRSDITG